MTQSALAFAGRKAVTVAAWAEIPARVRQRSERSMIDWNYWGQLPTVELHEAVALSLGIDPHNPRPESDAEVVSSNDCPYPGGITWVDRDYDERLGLCHPMESEDFRKRMGLAEAHGGTLQIDAGRVSLSMFAHWARSVGWTIPDELAKLAKAKSTRNEKLQQSANAVAERWQSEGKYDFSKRDVACELARNEWSEMKAITIERNIEKQW
jgi:hypothetical protein